VTDNPNPFDETVQKSNVWLNDVGEAVGVPDRHRAYQALRGTLHALRDRLSVDEAAHLGAQLPMLIRGLYYEGWRPAGKPLKERSQAEFLERVRTDIPGMTLDEAGIAAAAVFAVLTRNVTAGEVSDVRSALPEEVRRLWPAAA
jgi:uncharacterized protein (DUF2267 family)